MSTVPWVTGQVAGLTLVNAGTGQDVGQLTDGETVDLGAIGSKLNVRAELAGLVGGVAFSLDGVPVHTETSGPFTLAGDSKGHYNTWTPATGAHTLVATPLGGRRDDGPPGDPLTVQFTVQAGEAPATPPPPTPIPVTTGGSGTAWLTVLASGARPTRPRRWRSSACSGRRAWPSTRSRSTPSSRS